MSLKAIIETILSANPDANRELVANYVHALHDAGHDDLYGNRRLPNGRSIKEEARRMFAPDSAVPHDSGEDERERFSGYTADEFSKLSPDAKLRIHGENSTPPIPSWQAKSAPVTPGEILQRTGMSVADFDRLDPHRKLEIAEEVRFSRVPRGDARGAQ